MWSYGLSPHACVPSTRPYFYASPCFRLFSLLLDAFVFHIVVGADSCALPSLKEFSISTSSLAPTHLGHSLRGPQLTEIQ